MFAQIARALAPVSFAAALAVTPVLSPALADPSEMDAKRLAKPIVEVAFVLDTTGSMGPLIEGAKRKIWSIATAIVDTNPNAEIRMGLVAYRDIGDEYVTKTFNLTTDIQDLYANLLELKAHGGGDWPESVNEALEVGVTKLAWTQGPEIRRIMFLVGDAPPHMDYKQDTKYPDVIRTARDRGIVVNAVQAGGARDTERVWREIAQRGDGRYIPIPQDGGQILVIETPWDIEIIELQGRINGTVIPYGPRALRSSVEQKTAQITAAPRSVASEMAGYLSKSGGRSGAAVTGRGDLVGDVTSGRQKLDGVKDEDLPDNLRALKPVQRQAEIDKNAAERKTLNARMADLVKKRDAYVEQQRKNAPARPADSFDRAVAETLKVQIKR
ncbi:MAG TPA: vWA domain-containing protein [Xanthobacteraceae bacterium]